MENSTSLEPKIALESIRINLRKLKSQFPVMYAELIISEFHSLMYSPNSNASEKGKKAKKNVDDFTAKSHAQGNSAHDGWTGFNTHNEPYRNIDDL